MVIVLFAVCLVASAALGGIYTLTKEPIEAAQVAKTNSATAAVVPESDNNPSDSANVRVVDVDGAVSKVYVAKKGDEIVGYAIESSTSKGFSGNITIMVGFAPDGTIVNTSVISHAETPGLGAKIAEPAFYDKFIDKAFSDADTKFAVVKGGNPEDQNTVDAISGATITSQALGKGINLWVKYYEPYLKTVAAAKTEKLLQQQAAASVQEDTAGEATINEEE